MLKSLSDLDVLWHVDVALMCTIIWCVHGAVKKRGHFLHLRTLCSMDFGIHNSSFLIIMVIFRILPISTDNKPRIKSISAGYLCIFHKSK